MTAVNRYWSECVRQLTPYVPGEQPGETGIIKLNTNENPYPPSPMALAALRAAVNDRLRLYPDPESTALRETIANRLGVQPRQVFVGNGSDEVLAFVFQAVLKHELPILFPDITYSFYPVYCQLYGIAYDTVPLAEDFSLRITDYQRPCGGLIFPNPNAPTGRALSRLDIAELARAQPEVPLVIDEAYVDFGAESAVRLLAEHPNVLVVQTLSKSHALAGLRVGFALGSASLIEGLNRVKNSFNSYPLDRLAQAGAQASLLDVDYFEHCRARIIASREGLSVHLRQLGFEVLPSAANFIFVRHPLHDALALFEALRTRKILVRHFKQTRIAQFLRISIGTETECQALVETLQEIVGTARI